MSTLFDTTISNKDPTIVFPHTRPAPEIPGTRFLSPRHRKPGRCSLPCCCIPNSRRYRSEPASTRTRPAARGTGLRRIGEGTYKQNTGRCVLRTGVCVLSTSYLLRASVRMPTIALRTRSRSTRLLKVNALFSMCSWNPDRSVSDLRSGQVNFWPLISNSRLGFGF